MATDGVDHRGLVVRPAEADLLVIRLIMCLLKVRGCSKHIRWNRRAWLTRRSGLRDEDLVMELARRQHVLRRELANIVCGGIQLWLHLRRPRPIERTGMKTWLPAGGGLN